MKNWSKKSCGFSIFSKRWAEIVSKEDMDDLKLLRATRGEEAISFEEYLKNES